MMLIIKMTLRSRKFMKEEEFALQYLMKPIFAVAAKEVKNS
jgi:hypothetical protein